MTDLQKQRSAILRLLLTDRSPAARALALWALKAGAK